MLLASAANGVVIGESLKVYFSCKYSYNMAGVPPHLVSLNNVYSQIVKHTLHSLLIRE